MTERACDRCTATKVSGGRCSLTTCKTGPYCWIHTRSKMWLQVKKSQVPNAGSGLFANKPGARQNEIVWKKNAKICPYQGPLITRNQLERKYGDTDDTVAEYALHIGDGWYIDPYKTNAGVARYANDCHGTDLRCNAKFDTGSHKIVDPKKRQAKTFVVATRDIRNGEEILSNYSGNNESASYWKPKKKVAKRKTKNSTKN